MPAVQTTYNATMRQSFAGMKGNMRPEDIGSYVVEPAAGIGFGVPAYKGTGDRQITTVASARYIGVTMFDPVASATALTPPANVDQYQQYEIAAVAQGGTIWVIAPTGGVTAGDIATATTTGGAGALGVTAAGGTPGAGTVAIGVYDTSGAAGSLVILRVK